MAKDDRDNWWVFKVPKISIWWLVWAAMLGGYIYYQYGYVKNSGHSEHKQYAPYNHDKTNPLKNGGSVSQLPQLAKTIGDKSSDDILRRSEASKGTK
ncbi:hypothetical protein [Acidithiobacillus sulfuriphilus]|uniref:Uncharacterized protein n=1 Tax=Acidithiobacillus sulfuriphilus TaxID=1867749 RepID=A0ACD5HK76_9PROT|nr:hypothetical protein [Acidithiobacillus sulfuriphilus]